jgi:hypothetical protein
MAMQVRPAQTSDITFAIRTIVLQQQSRVLENARILKVYAQRVVGSEEFSCGKVLVVLFCVVCKDNVVRLCSTMCTGFCLVQSPHSDGANMTCAVVAGSDGCVLNG